MKKERLQKPKITQFDPRELEVDRPEDLVGLYNVDMQAFENIIKLNTMGTVYPLLAFAKYMTKQGGGVLFIPSHLVQEVVEGAAKRTRPFAYPPTDGIKEKRNRLAHLR